MSFLVHTSSVASSNLNYCATAYSAVFHNLSRLLEWTTHLRYWQIISKVKLTKKTALTWGLPEKPEAVVNSVHTAFVLCTLDIFIFPNNLLFVSILDLCNLLPRLSKTKQNNKRNLVNLNTIVNSKPSHLF